MRCRGLAPRAGGGEAFFVAGHGRLVDRGGCRVLNSLVVEAPIRAIWRSRAVAAPVGLSATDREELGVVAWRAQPALSQILHERAKVVEGAALDPQGTVGAPAGPEANLVHATGSALEQVARLVHGNQLRRITDRVVDDAAPPWPTAPIPSSGWYGTPSLRTTITSSGAFNASAAIGTRRVADRPRQHRRPHDSAPPPIDGRRPHGS